MASIQKRGKKYAVVYTYTDSADVKRQKWETYGTKKEAAARKAQVENEMNNGTFIPPSSVTVRDFLADFVELYGSKRWGLSAYSGNTGIINNYINPVIGDMNVQDVTRRTVDSFIAQLQKMKPVSTTYRNARSEFLPPNTIEKVCKVLHCAFRQAVRWDMVPKNPFDDVLLPKKEKNPRAIWTADIIRQALDNCSEGKLYVAINLSFACSLRMGEITGLTWDCVHISDSDIAKDDAHIIVNKELARVDQRAIDALGEKDIIFMFPRIVKAKSTTRLVLKRPKTETSIRKVWLPKTLAYILRDWHQKQDKLKEIMGDEYADYNLVLALETGRPCEDRVIGNQFERLKKSANLPNVVFHSLRHSSTTYKLKLNHGDITQAINPRYSASNVMLAMAQNPEITYINSLEVWNRLGRSVNRDENGMKIRVSDTYMKDGREYHGYKIGRVFDISQTHGKAGVPALSLKDNTPEMDAALRRLLDSSPVPVVTSSTMYQDAVYDPKTQSITVSSRLIDSKIFAALSREIVHAGIHDHGRYPYYTREDCAMDAESVSYMLCRNFGVETPQPDVSRVGQVFDGMEVQDRRGVVDSLQKYFRKLQNDIQREISPQDRKQPEQNRPVR